MIAGKGYTSVYEIIERVFDMYDTEDVSFSVLVRHIGDAIGLVGATKLFIPKTCEITIENYKGSFPSDLMVLKQVRYVDESNGVKRYRAMVSATDTFFISPSEGVYNGEHFKYEATAGHIHTKFESGIVEVAYKATPVDENGYPLIPNDDTVKMALEAFLLERIGFKMFLKNKMDQNKYSLLQQERHFYMGAFESAVTMPTPDEMESIANMMTRLIEKPLSHSRFFRDNSNPERLNIPNKNRF